jgi:hypothetical protein
MIVCIAKVVRSPLNEVVTAVLWIGFILAMTSASAAEDSQDRKPLSNLRDIKHIIVIYQGVIFRCDIDKRGVQTGNVIAGAPFLSAKVSNPIT